MGKDRCWPLTAQAEEIVCHVRHARRVAHTCRATSAAHARWGLWKKIEVLLCACEHEAALCYGLRYFVLDGICRFDIEACATF